MYVANTNSFVEKLFAFDLFSGLIFCTNQMIPTLLSWCWCLQWQGHSIKHCFCKSLSRK